MHKGRRKRRFSWWTDRSAFGALAGFGVVYFALVPLEAHPLHWLLSGLGGVAGYGLGLFVDEGLPRLRRQVGRRRR